MEFSLKFSLILSLFFPIALSFSSNTAGGCVFSVYAGYLYVKGPSTIKFGYIQFVLAVLQSIVLGSWDIYNNYHDITVVTSYYPIIKNILGIGLSFFGSYIFFCDNLKVINGEEKIIMGKKVD